MSLLPSEKFQISAIMFYALRPQLPGDPCACYFLFLCDVRSKRRFAVDVLANRVMLTESSLAL